MAHGTAEIKALIQDKRNIFILAGSLCDRVTFAGGKSLLDYAVSLARVLNATVGAATGLILKHCKEKGVPAKKTWAIEIIHQLTGHWHEPLPAAKPDLIIFIGYPPEVVEKFGSAIVGIDSIALSNRYVPGVALSAPDLSLQEWEEYLADIIRALKISSGGGQAND